MDTMLDAVGGSPDRIELDVPDFGYFDDGDGGSWIDGDDEIADEGQTA